jgi:hypothetical protein
VVYGKEGESGQLSAFLYVFDLGVLDVISLVQHANGWELRKIVRDLSQVQKGNSYPFIVNSLKEK